MKKEKQKSDAELTEYAEHKMKEWFAILKDCVAREEKARIGKELKKWFNGDGSEDVEDAILRICNIKV